MEKKMSILLIEDDTTACNEIAAYTETVDDVCLIGITNNVKKAIEYIHDYLPDAIILDLELHKGEGDGISLLKYMKEMSLTSRPYVLITTNNSSAITYEIAHELGADFIMSKHQADYSAKTPVDFLRTAKSIISQHRSANAVSFVESPEQKEKRLNRRISSELDKIGIGAKLVGYRYIIDAILIIMDKPETNLCTIIGKKYNKSEPSVERAMQTAINKAWRCSDVNELYKYYTAKVNPQKGVPTVTEFIYYYANKLKNE